MRQDAIDALTFWGHSEREAAFLYLVAVHSGYFLRRQFCEFTGRGRGSIATHFLRRAIVHGLIRAMDLDGRHFVYHLHGKVLYRMLDDPDSQNRRVKSGGEILRRLMVLDYVLCHLATQEFLETEAAKRRYFAQAGGNDTVASASAFGEPVPVSIHHDAQSQIARFAFVDEGQRSLSKFERFLTAHQDLLRALPHAEVVYVARRPQHIEDAKSLFTRRFSAQNNVHPVYPLGIEDLIRWLTVNRKFYGQRRSITPLEHHLLQAGECVYRNPIHAGVIASWNNGAMHAGNIRELLHTNATQIGFQTELLKGSYPRLLSFTAGHRMGHEDDNRDPQITLFHNEMAETRGQR